LKTRKLLEFVPRVLLTKLQEAALTKRPGRLHNVGLEVDFAMRTQPPSIIPAPHLFQSLPGRFFLKPDTPVCVEPSGTEREISRLGNWFAGLVNTATGWNLVVRDLGGAEPPPGAMLLSCVPADDAPAEGYTLDIQPGSLTIRAGGAAGIFYGLQTVRQLLPPEVERPGGLPGAGELTLPAARIDDQPRFRWRGLLLDCCRHFLTKDFVLRTIDLLALHKMNRLHWHLTEDQGWRIEIGKYPRLVEIGTWRTEADGSRHGGYYSQEDVREIVEYAQERFVTVVPEIEMPGHCLAALAAYPELSCTGGPFAVSSRWGVFEDVYCAGNDNTFSFLEDVLAEVLDLFPGEYVHVGGDEVPRTRWRSCPRCQERIRAEGLRDENELQSWFLARIGHFLAGNGRRLIGWDEILEGGLPPGATVQSWRSLAGTVEAASQGAAVIVSPISHAYLDQDLQKIDLAKVYDFEPVPTQLTPAQSDLILGGECNMWTERAPQDTVGGKVFPRLLAMAERLWSPADRRDFAEFRGRVREYYSRLAALQVRYGEETAT